MIDIELVHKWIELGDLDLGTAKVLFQHSPEYNSIICFHCQQAVEKYLKALLISKEIEFRFSHDLFYLMNLLDEREPIEEEWFRKAELLNDFAVKIRYPNGMEIPSNERILDIIAISESFRVFICSKNILPIISE